MDTDYNMFLGVQVMLQGDAGNNQMVKVAKKMRDDYGKPIEEYYDITLCNTEF